MTATAALRILLGADLPFLWSSLIRNRTLISENLSRLLSSHDLVASVLNVSLDAHSSLAVPPGAGGFALGTALGLLIWLAPRWLGQLLGRPAEPSLRVSQAQLQRITDSIAGCIAYIDAEQRYRFVNKTYEVWFGRSQPEIIGSKVKELLGKDQYAQVQPYIEQVFAGETVTYEAKVDYSTGASRYVSVVLVPDLARSQRIQGYYALISDISDRKRVELALADSQAKLNSILNNAAASIVQLQIKADRSLYYEYLSPGCEYLYGYTREEFLQDSYLWQRLVVPEDMETVIAPAYDQVFAGIPHQVEYRFYHKNGSTRWIRASVNPRWSEAQQCWLVIIVNLDVTEQKQAEAALRKSEAKQRAIIEALPDLLMRVHQSGVYLDAWSTNSFRLLTDPAQKVGRNITQLLPERIAQQRLKAIQAAIDTSEIQIYEQVIDFGNQQQIEEVRVVSAGEDEAILLVRDISDRKRAEAQLQEREASLREFNRRWRALLNDVQLIVIELNAEGYIEYANPFFLQLTDYSAEEVLGRCWFENFLPADVQASMRQIFQQFIQAGSGRSTQPDVVLTKAGERLAVAWNKTLLRDTEGNAIGVISIGEDVTRQHELELIKNEFLSVVSHELRTPLASIQGSLSLLDGAITDLTTADGQKVIAIANRGVDRLVHLVDTILDLRRLETGQMPLERRWFDAADLVAIALEEMAEIASQGSITIDTTQQSAQVYGDADLILQVLVNLLGNAIKFSAPGSTISLNLIKHPDHIMFSVADQGCGIAASQLHKIFDRFYQIDTSDARQKGGSGLGLAICRSIIRQHGGEIWAESVLGQGSCFYVTLPHAGDSGDDQ